MDIFEEIQSRFEKGKFHAALEAIDSLPPDLENEQQLEAKIWKNDINFYMDDKQKTLEPINSIVEKADKLEGYLYLKIKALLSKNRILVYFEKYDEANSNFDRILELKENFISNEARRKNSNLILYIDFEYGWFLEQIGNYDSAIKILTQTVDRATKEENFFIASFGSRRLGWCYYNLGNLKESQIHLENAFTYSKGRNLVLQGHALNALGILYVSKGDSSKALSYYFDGFEKLKIGLKDYYLIGTIAGNIGWLYLHQGEFMAAEDFLQKEISYYQGRSHYYAGLSNSYIGLIELYLAQNDVAMAQGYLDLLEELASSNKKWIITASFYYGKALMLLHKNRIADIAEAQILLKKIVEEKRIALVITYYAQIKLIEVLFQEIEFLSNTQIIEEIHSYLTNLREITKSKIILSIVLLIEAKLHLIQGYLEKSKLVLEETLAIARENGLTRQEILTNKELDNIDSYKQKWDKIKQENSSVVENFQIANIKTYFESIKKMVPK